MYSSGYVDNYIDYELKHINNLHGIAFEKYVCKLLKNVGYKDVYRTKDSGYFGLDVIAYNVQDKRIILDTFKSIKADNYIILIEFSNYSYLLKKCI